MKLVKQGAQGVHGTLWCWVANGHGGHDGIRGQKQKTGSGMKTASHECREAIRRLESDSNFAPSRHLLMVVVVTPES